MPLELQLRVRFLLRVLWFLISMVKMPGMSPQELSRQQAVDQRPQLLPGSAVAGVQQELGYPVHATEEHYHLELGY